MSSEQYDPTELLRIKSIRELAKLVPRVLRFSWQASPALICLVGAMAFLSALIEPAILFVTKLVVDSVHQSQGLGVNWALIIVPLGVVFALWIGRTLLAGVDGILHELLGHRIDNTASEKLLRKSATLDVAFFEAPKFYDQLQQAVIQQLSLQQMPGSLYVLLQQLVSLGAMAGLLSLLHPLAFLILVATVLPQFFFESHMAKLEFQLGSELARNWRHTNYMESLLTEREKAKEIRIFGLGNVFLDRFLKYRREYITANFRQMLRFMGYNLGLGSLSTIGVGVVSVYAVVQAARGQISLGTLTMVFAAAQEIVEYVRRLISSLSGTYQVSLQASRYFDLLDLVPNSIAGSLEPPRSSSPTVVSNSLHSGIALENVSFSYPATDRPVLKDVSFSIPAGSKVAIVGENGAGKTTLVKLLARFYDPVGGTIYLDGRDYRDYELSSLRANVSVVFQDFVKYDISASENIGVGRIEAVEDRSQIVQAARNAAAHRMVSKLPHGYDTVLGRTMDEGVDLSGGEWQHISIARAFMSDTPILILDEPTAALDSLRERELYERIAQLAKDKTVVFISHRFSTVRMADTIVVIDDGNSIEVGSHEELLDRRGKYYRMFETQARHYR